MKNSLLIPVVFLANLVIWVCSISIFSVLGVWRYLDAVSSGNFQLFFVMCAWRALYVLPVCLILALTITFLYLMRHRSLLFVSIPLVLGIVVASVFYLIPYSYRAETAIETRFPDAIRTWGIESPEMADSGFIRTDSSAGSRMWVDLAESVTSARRLLVADLSGNGGVLSFTGDALYDRESRSLVSATGKPIVAGGNDELFVSGMALPPFLRPLFRDAGRVLDSLYSVYRVSFNEYLLISGSFFIAIVSLWCLCWASGWRMLNVLLVFAAERGLFFLWPAADGGIIARTVEKFLSALIPSDIVLPLVYLAVSALMLVVSFFVFLTRKIRHVKSGAFYE